MKYILADKSKCVGLGIKVSGHLTKEDKIVLNEKEMMFSPYLASADSLDEKAALVDGEIFNSADLLNIINN